MFELSKKQEKALGYLLDNSTGVVGYGGGANSGKSFLGCYWLQRVTWAAPNTRYFIGRNNIKDTQESVLISWTKLSKLIGFDDYWTFSDGKIKISNGSEIVFLDLTYYPFKDPMFERLGSKEFTGGWVEEIGEVHSLALEVLKSRVGRHYNDEYGIKSKILCTMNPKKGYLKKLFYDPNIKNQETRDTKFVQALVTDNPYASEDSIEQLNNIKDKATKERLLKGNWDYDNDPTSMISYDQIEAIWSNNHIKKGKNKYITADIARYGSDKAVIFVWEGFVIVEIITFDISSTTDIQNAINALRIKHGIRAANCVGDDDGVGGGVIDNTKIRGFVNNSKPMDKGYYNLKTECGYLLAEHIDEIHVEAEVSNETNEIIEAELSELKTYDADKDGKLRILPKEKIKQNIGRSPDYLDNFIMRMYFINRKGKIDVY